MARFKIDGMDNLMKMEEFDDVKDLAAEISKMEDQMEELRKCYPSILFVERLGKDELAEELRERINTNTEMKASIQAMHVKDEKEKLPPEVKFMHNA